MRRLLLIATLPFVAGAAFAQGTPAPDLSPAATATMARLRQGDPLLKQLYGQIRNTNSELQLAAQRPSVDAGQVAALIKRADGLQAQFRSHQSDQLIAAMKALPPADRGPLLRALGIGASSRPK